MNSNGRTIIVALAALLVANAAGADETTASFDLRAAAAYQYDSNVSLEELDATTGSADNATLLELELGGRLPVTERVSLNLGYGFSQTRWQEFSDFDTALHRLQGDVAWRAGNFDTGLALRHFAAHLDGERFLDLHQVSPSVGRLFGRTLYLRGAYTRSEKAYASADERDATNDALDVDAYVLLDGMRRYLAFGYRLDRESAASEAFAYDGQRLKFTWGNRFDSLELKARLQVEARDYRGITESLGEARRDRRFRGGLTLALPIGDYFAIEGEAAYADNASNLPDYDFDETIVSLGLAAEF